MAHDVFISHSSKDKTVADKVCEKLEANGIRCWVAPRNIRPGADWGEAIIDALRASRVVVLIFSGHANLSQQIKREVNRAVDRGIPIIPFRIEDVMPSGSMEYSISTSHWLNAFTSPIDQHLDELTEVVRESLDLPPPAPTGEEVKEQPTQKAAAARKGSAPKRPGSGWKIGLAVAAVVMALGGLGYYFGIVLPAASAQQGEKTAPTGPPPTASTKSPMSGQSWTNSQGVKFVPAGSDGVLFSVWDVRVKDFTEFVEASGYDATGGMYSLKDGKFGQFGGTWKSPGFTQTGDDPVVGVSWKDAQAYSDWLTKKEQADGLLSPDQFYRLPKDVEWSKAVGLNEAGGGSPKSKDSKIIGIYPWGKDWPPPRGAGNYAGSEARVGSWPSEWKTIDGYNDGYPRTSPVGSFAPNAFGIYDLGGNVWQWCDDKYDDAYEGRVLRGGSWVRCETNELASSFRHGADPDYRGDGCGFRIVVVVSP